EVKVKVKMKVTLPLTLIESILNTGPVSSFSISNNHNHTPVTPIRPCPRPLLLLMTLLHHLLLLLLLLPFLQVHFFHSLLLIPLSRSLLSHSPFSHPFLSSIPFPLFF